MNSQEHLESIGDEPQPLKDEIPSDKGRPLRVMAFTLSATCLVISILVLMGWLTNNLVLASVSVDYVPMTMSIAISMFLLSIGVFIRVHLRLNCCPKVIPFLLASTVLVIMVWVLLDPVIPADLDIEVFLHPGRELSEGYLLADTSPVSAIVLITAGAITISSLCSTGRCGARNFIESILSIGVFSVGLLTLLGYAYGNPLFYGGDVRPISLLSGLSFAMYGMALISFHGPDCWPTNKFVGNSVEARLLRVFLPLSVAVVLITGSLSNRALSISGNPALAASLVALITVIIVGYSVTRISGRIGGQIDQAEETARRAEEGLRVANEKLRVLGSMTRHDALNQLAVVLGRLDLVRTSSKDPLVLKQVNESLKSAESIRQMLQFTAEYQKIGVSGSQWIGVQDAFEKATEHLEASGIQTTSDIRDLEILSDIMFEKVLANLIDNSQRHGKTVMNITLHHHVTDDSLMLVYEDDGVGLTQDEKANLFRPGFGKHTGYGMFLSREILEFGGLSIFETGDPGKGARFEIKIPKDRYRFSTKDA